MAAKRRFGWIAAWTAFSAAGSGCAGDDPAQPSTPAGYRPALVCPGDPQCATNDGQLSAGAAVRSIVPDCFETWDDLDGDATYDAVAEPFHDCGCDASCAGDPGYPGPDEGEGDGKFQAVWIAGFQNSRPANGVRGAELGFRGAGDGLWATAVVLDQGDTRIAIVAVDAFGVMIDDTVALRDAADAAGLGIDHLLLHSSHSHAAPDTLGIYGQTLSNSGYDPAYAAQIRATVVDALTEAIDGLEPVQLEVGTVDAGTYHPNGVGNLIVDTRDPVVIDPIVGVARFVAAADGATVATVVHFSNHPEETADVWALLSANFVHALRRTVEEGVDWGDGLRPGLGGVAVYLNGTVGGMMTSLGAEVEDPNGTIWPARTFEKSDALGQLLGGMALDAAASAEVVDAPRISVVRDGLYLPVVNNGFQAMFLMGTLAHRSVYHFDESQPIGEDNAPDVASEVGLIDIGPLSLMCLPGEPFPELALGGYDGAFTPPNQALVASDNPNPPDVGAGMAGPYLGERLADRGARWGWVVGLANDQIGYLVPPTEFEVGKVPYLIEADGDHYEETNSLGPDTVPKVLDAAHALIDFDGG